MASNRSYGEEAFAQVFQFASSVPSKDHEELRDFFYKFAHNLSEAREYLQILSQVNEIEHGQKSELLFRIQAMAIQCFPLAMRRLTDNISKRSVQKLLNKIVRNELKDAEVKKVKLIYSHYSSYLNKGVAHQDKHSIKQTLEAFPDASIIDTDMEHLEQLYYKLVREICTSYINVSRKPHSYMTELERLRVKA